MAVVYREPIENSSQQQLIYNIKTQQKSNQFLSKKEICTSLNWLLLAMQLKPRPRHSINKFAERQNREKNLYVLNAIQQPIIDELNSAAVDGFIKG
jgi:hypothetical protein